MEFTLIFSFSSVGEVNDALVMGCKSPFATPWAISVSTSLRSVNPGKEVRSDIYEHLIC
jgi:hypothetical protein